MDAIPYSRALKRERDQIEARQKSLKAGEDNKA
jgi:hypothetical protein